MTRYAPPEVGEDPDASRLLAEIDGGDEEAAFRLRTLRRHLLGRDRAEVERRA